MEKNMYIIQNPQIQLNKYNSLNQGNHNQSYFLSVLIVNNKKMYEENFKLFGVDSNYLHSAENNSNEIRVILYIDKSLI